jgi:hypothetical protein
VLTISGQQRVLGTPVVVLPSWGKKKKRRKSHPSVRVNVTG